VRRSSGSSQIAVFLTCAFFDSRNSSNTHGNYFCGFQFFCVFFFELFFSFFLLGNSVPPRYRSKRERQANAFKMSGPAPEEQLARSKTRLESFMAVDSRFPHISTLLTSCEFGELVFVRCLWFNFEISGIQALTSRFSKKRATIPNS
jgi:hypothetical protein